MNSTATIADIARHAGVGTATVDRVLNGRPGVNAETMQKVMTAVADLGKPPVLRGRPRMRENFRFAFLLPEGGSPFIDLIERQIALAAGDFRHQRITEITQRYDAEDSNKFVQALAQVEDCEGIAILAPDLPAFKLAINDCVRNGVHVVTLLSDVAGSMREAYIGVDNRAAGRTAGILLGRMANRAGCDTLLLASQATRYSAEIERRIGFAQVIEERFPHLRCVRTPDLPLLDSDHCEELSAFIEMESSPDRIAGIYSVCGYCEGIAGALEKNQISGQTGFVAHDATAFNQSLLIDGRISYLLHQDIHYCVQTAAKVLKALCENVRGALSVVPARVEILTAENLH